MKAVKYLALPAVIGLGALLVLSSGGPAVASTVPNWVGVAQTVLVSTAPDGQVSGTPQVFTQVAANGSGPVTFEVPMSSAGFRNLSSLKTPAIMDGEATWNLQLSGPFTERTVAHFPAAQLPLQVSARYYLNGQKMSATDIVGKSGLLQVYYTVTNTTTEPVPVEYKDVFGKKETTSVLTPVPYAASLSVTLPANFTNVSAPGASANGNGNGTVGLAWTAFLFEPLGAADQTFTYQAQVTDAAVPSAMLSAQALPAGDLNQLPTIHEPGAPPVPSVTVGGRLASFQATAQQKLQEIATKASAFLASLKKILVPAAQGVSSGAAKLAVDLSNLSTQAQGLSTSAGDLSARIAQHAADAASSAGMIADIQTSFAALPTAICSALSKIPTPTVSPTRIPTPTVSPTSTITPTPSTSPSPSTSTSPSASPSPSPSPIPSCVPKIKASPSFTAFHSKLVALEDLIVKLSADLTTSSGLGKTLQADVLKAASSLATSSTNVNSLSAKAAQVASTIADASTTVTPKNGKTVQPKQIGGGGQIDAAVAQLDAAITKAGQAVDDNYAYLTALNTRAGDSLLPAGNASGATSQVGALIWSIGGADNSQHQAHLALIVGITGLFIGATLGLGLYRIRRGEGSSLAPPAKT